MGRLEAYLEAAALRSEFKTVAGDLRMGLDRLETDHVHVPVDVADDVAVLSGQLAAVEFSVASDQEVAAAEIHRTVLLERLGLAHDHQILGLIKVYCVFSCVWDRIYVLSSSCCYYAGTPLIYTGCAQALWIGRCTIPCAHT